MKNRFFFKDFIYPYQGIDHRRIIVRGVVLNDKNEVALNHVVSDDDFGHRDCYELPGGGKKKNETLREGVLREVEEEIGYKCHVITILGKVIDYYNYIKRENHSFYYLLKADTYVGTHQEEYEKRVIQEQIFVPVDEAIKLMERVHDDGVGLLIAQREIPILKLAKEYLENEHLISK